MATIMPESELLRRAFAHLLTQRAQHPEKKLSDLLDDASMRFNLSPKDAESLQRLLHDEEPRPGNRTKA